MTLAFFAMRKKVSSSSNSFEYMNSIIAVPTKPCDMKAG